MKDRPGRRPVSGSHHPPSARFLERPHPLLDGATPLDMARSCSAGAHAVLNLLRRAEAGVAV